MQFDLATQQRLQGFARVGGHGGIDGKAHDATGTHAKGDGLEAQREQAREHAHQALTLLASGRGRAADVVVAVALDGLVADAQGLMMLEHGT